MVFMAIKRDKLTCDSVSQTITKPVSRENIETMNVASFLLALFLSETMGSALKIIDTHAHMPEMHYKGCDLEKEILVLRPLGKSQL